MQVTPLVADQCENSPCSATVVDVKLSLCKGCKLARCGASSRTPNLDQGSVSPGTALEIVKNKIGPPSVFLH